jgi:16S rRNA (guanine527-N7)-methyltransferase
LSADLLVVHRELLEQWRTVMNLVGPGGLDEHYVDADRGLRALRPTGQWADLGSGAGFPGIPFLARFPAVQLDLVESRAKRATFLEEVLGRTGLRPPHARVVRGRVEDVPPHSYDGILARAFASPDVVLTHAERLLVPGGTAVLFLTEDQPLPALDGFEVFHVEHYEVDRRSRRTVELRRV